MGLIEQNKYVDVAGRLGKSPSELDAIRVLFAHRIGIDATDGGIKMLGFVEPGVVETRGVRRRHAFSSPVHTFYFVHPGIIADRTYNPLAIGRRKYPIINMLGDMGLREVIEHDDIRTQDTHRNVVELMTACSPDSHVPLLSNPELVADVLPLDADRGVLPAVHIGTYQRPAEEIARSRWRFVAPLLPDSPARYDGMIG